MFFLLLFHRMFKINRQTLNVDEKPTVVRHGDGVSPQRFFESTLHLRIGSGTVLERANALWRALSVSFNGDEEILMHDTFFVDEIKC